MRPRQILYFLRLLIIHRDPPGREKTHRMPLFQLLQGYTDPVYILQISPLVIGVWLDGHEIISQAPILVIRRLPLL